VDKLKKHAHSFLFLAGMDDNGSLWKKYRNSMSTVIEKAEKLQ